MSGQPISVVSAIMMAGASAPATDVETQRAAIKMKPPSNTDINLVASGCRSHPCWWSAAPFYPPRRQPFKALDGCHQHVPFGFEVLDDPVEVHLYAAFRSPATYSCLHGEPWRVRIFSRFNWSAIFRSDLPPFLSR